MTFGIRGIKREFGLFASIPPAKMPKVAMYLNSIKEFLANHLCGRRVAASIQPFSIPDHP